MKKKWIKVPGPGEFRGEGKWMLLEDTKYTIFDWDYCVNNNYLPTAEQEEKPTE